MTKKERLEKALKLLTNYVQEQYAKHYDELINDPEVEFDENYDNPCEFSDNLADLQRIENNLDDLGYYMEAQEV